MRLYIDDVRDVPEGYDLARNSTAAIELMKYRLSVGTPYTHVSFDHDLGDDDTTRRVVMWMIEYEHPPISWNVHSANPVGKEWLEGTLSRYLTA